MKKQYVDVLKGLACIVVIFLHCPLPGLIGDGIIYGLRFSVPVFFMVSGYFSFSRKNEWILSKAKYIMKLIIGSELFYGGWTIIYKCLIQQNTIQELMQDMIFGKNVFRLIFCGTLFNGTLWYLYAMFWTWIIIYSLRRTNHLSKVYILIPILLGIQIFGRAYVQNFYDIDKYVILFRNVITFGVPFTLLGVWIAENEKKLIEKISIRNNIFIILGGFGLIILEFFTFGQYMDTHVSTVFVSAGMFLYAIRLQGQVHKGLHIFRMMGSKWYMWVYLSHIFVIEVIQICAIELQITDNLVFQYGYPFLVCIVACICSEAMERLKKLKL